MNTLPVASVPDKNLLFCHVPRQRQIRSVRLVCGWARFWKYSIGAAVGHLDDYFVVVADSGIWFCLELMRRLRHVVRDDTFAAVRSDDGDACEAVESDDVDAVVEDA